MAVGFAVRGEVPRAHQATHVELGSDIRMSKAVWTKNAPLFERISGVADGVALMYRETPLAPAPSGPHRGVVIAAPLCPATGVVIP